MLSENHAKQSLNKNETNRNKISNPVEHQNLYYQQLNETLGSKIWRQSLQKSTKTYNIYEKSQFNKKGKN